MGVLVDAYGRTIDTTALTQDIATAQVTGVRQVWNGSMAAGLTPERMVRVLENSIYYDPRDYLVLAEEMEERDPHYFSVLGTRKLAVESIDVVIEAASDDARDVKLADATRELFKLECVAQSRAELLDALGKSFSVCEIKWDRSGKQWFPERVEHRDPTWFQFDVETRRELRLRDQIDPLNGLPLAPARFIQHRPRLKSGLPIRNGLARIAAFTWICKAYALKDWMAFAEVFGMPVRVGRYGPNASSKDVATLQRAVANIGSDAACVIPESMKIEFIQTGSIGGGKDLFQGLSEFLDRQISKAVLGQTSTSDAQASGLGSNNADVHNEVRGDIRDADGGQLAGSYKRDLVKPFVDLNFGPQQHYPNVIIRKKKPEDIKALTEALRVLVPMGFEVEQSVIRDKIGLPDPQPSKNGVPVKLLGAPAAPAAPAAGDPERALNSSRPAAAAKDDEVDRLVDDGIADWTEQMAEIVDPIEQLAAESADEAEFLRRLPDLARTLTPAKLLRGLATKAFQARGLGDATDKV